MASYSPVRIIPLSEEPTNRAKTRKRSSLNTNQDCVCSFGNSRNPVAKDCAETGKRSCLNADQDCIASCGNPRNPVAPNCATPPNGADELVSMKNAEQCKASCSNSVRINRLHKIVRG